ncbi:ROK family protein [Microbacterium sp. ZW T5_56]|uniref:ROK family transcriptional regulator n=1 Tax=Microbacterium sp. ZW T5_56 TaxID=3378081 RepID=UPI0038533A67
MFASSLSGDQGVLWELNARALFAEIARQAPVGRPELVASTGLSRTTVTQTLARLVTAGVVCDAGLDRARRGPAATLYEVAPDAAAGVVVHITRHKIIAAVHDFAGSEIARAEKDEADPLCVADTAVSTIRAAAAIAELSPDAVVVAAPAVIAADGRTIAQLPGYLPSGTALYDHIADELGCAVTIDNDLALLARAKLAFRSGTFAVLSLRDGLGAGLVVNGRVHRGGRGLAGEVAYVPQPGVEIGSPALSEEIIARLARAEDAPEVLPELLSAADAGHRGAGLVLDEIARRLAYAAGSLTLMLDPDAVILADHAALGSLPDRVVAAVRREAGPLRIPIEISTLGENGPLLGAAAQLHDALVDLVFTRLLVDSPTPRRSTP